MRRTTKFRLPLKRAGAFFPLVTSVASDELLILVIFVPKRAPQKRVVLFRRRFAELARDAILIVASLHGSHGRRIGAEVSNRSRCAVTVTSGRAAATRFTAGARGVAAASARARIGSRTAALLRD